VACWCVGMLCLFCPVCVAVRFLVAVRVENVVPWVFVAVSEVLQ